MVTRTKLIAGALVLLVVGFAGWTWWRTAPLEATDAELQRAADGLLAAVNPELTSNGYFPGFVKDQLRWFNTEHTMGRLDVRFFHETPTNSLPPDIVMASMREGGTGVIFLSKRRFAADLRDTGGVGPPFNARQRNDFTISLVHEIVHLRHPEANPADPLEHAREELRVWSEVNALVVRPLRQLSQPLHPRFLDVDDALHACQDSLPCPALERLVRLQM